MFVLPRGLVTSQETGSVKKEWSTITSYVSPETSLIILPPLAHLVWGLDNTHTHKKTKNGKKWEKNERKRGKGIKTGFHTPYVNSILFVWINHHSAAGFLCWLQHIFVAALHAVTSSLATWSRQHVPYYARQRVQHRVPAKKNKSQNDKWVAPPPMKTSVDNVLYYTQQLMLINWHRIT